MIANSPNQLSISTPEPTSGWIDWGIGFLLSVIIITGLTILLVIYSPLEFKPIKGTTMIKQAEVCDLNISECRYLDDFNSITLPHVDRKETPALTRNWIYHISYDAKHSKDILQALYLPKFSETLQIHVNGQLIEDMPHFEVRQTRRWSRPELYLLPKDMLGHGGNEIQIRLSGYKLLGSDLFPIYIGNADILKKSFDQRYWLTRGLSRISLALSIIATLAIGVLWLLRRDSIYFWLIISNLACIVITSAFAFDVFGISFLRRLSLIFLSVEVFVAALFMFYAAYIQVRAPRLRTLYLIFVTICSFVFILFPEPYHPFFIKTLLILGFPLGFIIPAMVWVFRRKTSTLTFFIMFLAYCGTAVLLTHDATLVTLPNRVINTAVLPLFPIFYLATVLWLILSQLLSSLDESETLSQTLQQRVNEKTTELKKSYETLAQTQRKQTLDQERQRIMMDLHDGIGGHLVNTIAYMENSNLEDPTLKAALENALRDLSFMIDSLENDENITTLLGMFRARVEPLLDAHNIRFNWEIGDEPNMPKKGPSLNLNLLRIVQEAVTNSIKHSGADTITIKTDSKSVQVSDNGRGFNVEEIGRTTNKAGGVGFISMRKRAQDIGAIMGVSSNSGGTRLTLSWD